MERDIRQTALYKEVEAHFEQALKPSFGKISGALEPCLSPHGRTVTFTGSRWEKLEGSVTTRLCSMDIESGALRELTSGPNSDRSPLWSPNGAHLAFVSDRREKGQFKLYLLEPGQVGEAVATPPVDGTVEYFRWSTDSAHILLGVADRGADLAGSQGSGTNKTSSEDLPSWMPAVDSGAGKDQWRRLHLYDLQNGEVRLLTGENLNVWEAAWAGSNEVLAIVSDDPTEDAWYGASLALIDVKTGHERVLYRSDWQLALPAASPSGQRLTVVQALCSDRGVVAGNLLEVDRRSGEASRVETGLVDVTHAVWVDDEHLLYAGLRGSHAVVGEYNASARTTRPLWETSGSAGPWNPTFAPVTPISFLTVINSFDQYPQVTLVEGGRQRAIGSLEHDGTQYVRSLGGRLEEVTWIAPDGLEIGGLLICPDGPGPYPLIVNVHGGPIGTTRNQWLGVSSVRLLVHRGFAVLFPNPRGSAGRGQDFARMVYGDMGGAETLDHLSGLDAMIERGIADPDRLGVTGGSHGGFMTCRLVTETDRFAAAVALMPVTNFYSQHGTSNIGRFDRLFLQDDPSRPEEYFHRSPVMFAHRVKTPTFLVAGGRDRCTPAGQAIEFHRALLEQGMDTALAIYPEEGHGVRQLPALIDLTTRIIEWFERYMPPK